LCRALKEVEKQLKSNTIQKSNMASYYDSNKATSANSKDFILDGSEQQHFPFQKRVMGCEREDETIE
jgi:hypothetical protein